ncbi:DNA end-binding protein Ku [Paramicrobacterium humi]|uniref:Non-homologous end joining protein Ku n=1 Tax=Paramicrobacterium humi TaxID=640635 RepID=A0A1H4Q3C3_9MICO|nr:Ku protein [Microbacterium humi]SEC13912.1 DNA end-binding protein Ku [Microbacterium humi]
MRAIWTGAITFGLVNVPVKLYSATEDHDVSLHQVHDKDGGRIRYQRRCEVCGRVISYDHIDKAYVEGDETVILTEEDLASLPQERSREISVVEFVPSNQIDPILLDRSYYLEPSGRSPKAYVLLRQTLEKTDRTAIVQFALRQKTRLAALRVRDDVLLIQTMRWADEVREVSFPVLDEKVRVTAKELELSAALVKSFASDFAPEEFHDEYQEELRTLIDAKLEQGESLDTEATFGEVPEKEGAEVIDLMEALKRSVEKSRASKGKKPAAKKPAAKKTADADTATAKESPAKKAPAKKTPAKKAPAKKPAAKKPAAKKTPARKKSA